MKHWIESIANDLKEMDIDKHVIASGTSISGSIHIGNSCDVFIADAVGKALKKEGIDSETLWIADDHDPLRKVPYPLPKNYDKYLGKPYSMIPCPDGSCANFVEHFEKPFLSVLDKFEIDIETKSGFEMYKEGIYNDYIRIALENKDKIIDIFNKYREHPLAEDWLPYNPICEKCGRVNTTFAYDFNGDEVSYRCECGHDGDMDIKSGEGKLTWRVEWAARWKILGVTCEPFGKDHAASGGSYDVSKIISKEIFDYPAPYPVPYEWITLKGEAMSKSQGVFFTPAEWLEIGPAESLKYFLFRSKPLKQKDFSPEMPFLDLIEQFDRVEKVYYGVEEAPSEKEEKKGNLNYEMAKQSDTLPFRPSYRFLTVAYQIVGNNLESLFGVLKRNAQLDEDIEFNDLNEIQLKYFQERVDNVKNWLEKYAPKFVKFEVQKDLPDVNINPEQDKFIKELADLLESKDFSSAEELHEEMYQIMNKNELKPQKGFQAIYRLILGQKQGPRAASFLMTLDKDFVIKRFREDF